LVVVDDAPTPACPPGGLLVRTAACGLCSGELMEWYMDQKAPHVLGHEVSGWVEQSEDERFAEGDLVFVHHHAPCMDCALCRRGAYVHCPRWKATRLDPGGMAERFAVAPENLSDSFCIDGISPEAAALIEPLGCVVKSMGRAGFSFEAEEGEEEGDGEQGEDGPCAVVGLGAMGLAHLLLSPEGSVGFETNPARREWTESLGLLARPPETGQTFATVFVCPGSQEALDFALSVAAPDATVVLFAPLPPGRPARIDLHDVYFRDLRLITTYSCGPKDTRTAYGLLAAGLVAPEQIVSDFVTLDDLPAAYGAMKRGEILKAMVRFGPSDS
jgi:L-iditol 2-dehydrogenase